MSFRTGYSPHIHFGKQWSKDRTGWGSYRIVPCGMERSGQYLQRNGLPIPHSSWLQKSKN